MAHSAVLAAETRGSAGSPASLSCVSYPPALFLGSTSPPGAGSDRMGKRSAHVCSPSGLWRCLESSANVPSCSHGRQWGMKGWLWAYSCAKATSWKGRASWGRNRVATPPLVTGFFGRCLPPVNLSSTSTAEAVSLKASF